MWGAVITLLVVSAVVFLTTQHFMRRAHAKREPVQPLCPFCDLEGDLNALYTDTSTVKAIYVCPGHHTWKETIS